MFSKKTLIFVARNIYLKQMKFTVRIDKNYQAPAIEVVECVVEQGFDATGGSETDLTDFENENEI